MPMSPEIARDTMALAREVRNHGQDSPRVPELRRALVTQRVAEFVERQVKTAPPLHEEQIERIVLVLRGGERQ